MQIERPKIQDNGVSFEAKAVVKKKGYIRYALDVVQAWLLGTTEITAHFTEILPDKNAESGTPYFHIPKSCLEELERRLGREFHKGEEIPLKAKETTEGFLIIFYVTKNGFDQSKFPIFFTPNLDIRLPHLERQFS